MLHLSIFCTTIMKCILVHEVEIYFGFPIYFFSNVSGCPTCKRLVRKVYNLQCWPMICGRNWVIIDGTLTLPTIVCQWTKLWWNRVASHPLTRKFPNQSHYSVLTKVVGPTSESNSQNRLKLMIDFVYNRNFATVKQKITEQIAVVAYVWRQET